MFIPRATYQRWERDLAPHDQAVRAVLIGVIVFSVWLLIQRSRTLRAAGTLWLVLP